MKENTHDSSLLKKAYSGSIHQYFAAFFIAIFAFFTSVYIIRELTVEEFGIYHFLLSIILLAQVTTSLGLAQTIQRYLPEYKEKNNVYFQKRILSISVLIRLLAGFTFVSVLIIADNWIINIFNLPQFSQKFFPLLSLIILLVLESQLLGDAALVALFENKYWNFSKTTYTCLKFILFYHSLSMGYGITGIIWCWLIVETILFLLFVIKAHKVIFSLPIKKEDVQPLPFRRFINFGKYMLLAQSTYFFRDKAADIFILSYFLGTHAVGLYSFAFGIPLMLMSFSPGNKLRAISIPFLVHRYTRTNNKQELSHFFTLINKMTFFIMLPIVIVFMVLADKTIMYIFSPEYLEVTNLFILSLGFLMILQFAYPYSLILFTLEKSKIVFIGSFAAVYNLIMDLILIPPFGILGAILATGSAGIISLIYYHFAVTKDGTIKLKYPWSSFGKFSVNIAITALTTFLLRDFINNVLSLILVLAIAGIVYLGLSYLNKGFGEKDRKIFNDAMGKDIFVF